MPQCPNCFYTGNQIPHWIDGRESTRVQCWGVKRGNKPSGSLPAPAPTLESLKSSGVLQPAAKIPRPKKPKPEKPPKAKPSKAVIHHEDTPSDPQAAPVQWTVRASARGTDRSRRSGKPRTD